MSYLTPADVTVSDDRAAHLARGSKEPGTDYETAFGTDLRAPANGIVRLIDSSPGGAEGRRISFLLDDGRVIDWIHLSKITTTVGKRVTRGQRGIALSGASGFGAEHYYGSHVHVTLRADSGRPFRQTLDFETYLAAPAGGGTTTPGAGSVTTGSEHPDMFIAIIRKKDWYLVVGGKACLLGANSNARKSGAPILEFPDDWAVKQLKTVVSGIA